MNPKNESRKNKIFGFIREYISERGYSPTYSEIAEHSGCSAPLAMRYVDRLVDEGALVKSGRGRLVLTGRRSYEAMPVVGAIACGKPHLAVEDVEAYIPIDREMLGGGEFFGLVADGDSMNDAGIEEGDVVYIRRGSAAEDGDIVVALIEGEYGEGSYTTLKRFYRDEERECFRLHPENSAYEDIIVKELTVLGIAVRVLKKL